MPRPSMSRLTATTTDKPSLGIARTIPPPCSGSMNGEIAMRTITSALVALLVIAGVAGTAQALDAKTFYEQVDRNHN